MAQLGRFAFQIFVQQSRVNATDIIGTCAEHHLKALREHYEQLHHEDHSLTEDKLYDAQSYLKELLEHNPIQWSKTFRG